MEKNNTIMKRLSYLVVILLLASNMYAQTLDDVGRMSINVQRPNNRTIPTEALDILEDRMHQIITTSGISDNAFNKRFALTATVSVMKKDIIAGSPARVSQTLELVFYVKDIIDGKEYGNSSISTVGVGLTWLDLGHEMLGHSFSLYPYILFNAISTDYFQMRLKVAGGLAAVTEHWYTQEDQDPDHYGLSGSATQVERIFPPEKQTQKHTVTGDADAQAEALFALLGEKKLL